MTQGIPPAEGNGVASHTSQFVSSPGNGGSNGRGDGGRVLLSARGPRRLGAAALAVLVLASGLTIALHRRAPELSARDQNWQQDIAYLAHELPRVHIDGLLQVKPSAWSATADRLESRVPRLTNGQVIVGMAQMVAVLHDDETRLVLPPAPVYPFDARWVGDDLDLIAVPAAERWMLGSRLMAVDGHPISLAIRQLRAEIDYQDQGLVRAWEIGWDRIGTQTPGYLNNADLLYWLGLTSSAAWARFTVQTASGVRSVRLHSVGPAGGQRRAPPMAHVPTPMYRQHPALPYWLQVLPSQRAVYLKYNACLANDGFQRLAAEALQVMRQHPDYRLIVDLRDNLGGDSQPFLSLTSGIRADHTIDRRGRVFGLVNDLTDSSASLDAYYLTSQTRALLIGQPVADPIDEFGNDNGILWLPHYGIVVQYTTKVVNPRQVRFGIPDITIAPTLQDWLTGIDPVLAAALSYGRTPSSTTP